MVFQDRIHEKAGADSQRQREEKNGPAAGQWKSTETSESCKAADNRARKKPERNDVPRLAKNFSNRRRTDEASRSVDEQTGGRNVEIRPKAQDHARDEQEAQCNDESDASQKHSCHSRQRLF
jgi:hypothetical protein